MEVDKAENFTIVTVLTRVDANSAKEMEMKISELLNAGIKKILCNFSKNEYISCVGLRVFLSALKAMKKAGGSIVLCSLNPHVREVFDMAGFIPLFQIFDTVDDAIKVRQSPLSRHITHKDIRLYENSKTTEVKAEKSRIPIGF